MCLFLDSRVSWVFSKELVIIFSYLSDLFWKISIVEYYDDFIFNFYRILI